MDALQRASEMMRIPMKDLPEIAIEYAKHLCNRVGMCMEALYTAWAVYAQIVEKLPCDDFLYIPNGDAILFYRERGFEYNVD
jgi:hypothetical protein